MLTAFQVCFFVGVGLALISFIAGHLFGLFGVDGLDFDLFGAELSLPLSPTVYILGITVFGGVGWILTESGPMLSGLLLFLLAALAGIAGGGLFYAGIVRPLKKAENTSAPDEDELIGALAFVTETIPRGGFGEITYVIHGNSFSAPAKSTTGEELLKGSEASVCWIEEHVFYVAALASETEAKQ